MEKHLSIRGERVRLICTREGITQQELAKRIFQTQQSISRIVNGKQTLTEATAAAIIKCFPKYRIQWLLGYDDHETEEDLGKAKSAKNEEVRKAGETLLINALRSVCKRNDREPPAVEESEYLILMTQIMDSVESIAWQFLNRDESYFWILYDSQFSVKLENQSKNDLEDSFDEKI